ncbi:MAG: phage portal protein [Propionibacteriales bacterium]|nr:phage portal protein [Propionibacteriales bacterium]
MGLFSRNRAPAVRLDPVLPAVETRRSMDYGPSWGGLHAMSAEGGRSGAVPNHLAETLSSISGAVELIASSIASLPASLVQDTPDGLRPAPDSATAWALIARPNPRQSWSAWAQMSVAQLLMHGNSVSWLGYDGRGAVTSLTPVPWGWLDPKIVRGSPAPRLVFDLTETGAERWLLGLPDRLLCDDCLHVRGRSDTGVLGRSALSRAARVVREGVEISTTADAIWANKLNPSGFIETGGAVLSPDQRDRFRASLSEFRGSANAGRTMLLEGTFKYSALSVTPADAELLGSRRFSVSEVCRLFLLPEGMLQTGAAAPDYAALAAAYAQQCLSPIVTAFEQEFDAAVLPPGMHLSVDLGGLQRGSYSAIAASQAVLVQSGIASPNDGRRAVGLPATAGGDVLRPNGAPPSWPADATGMPSLSPKPGHVGPDGLPHIGTNQAAT